MFHRPFVSFVFLKMLSMRMNVRVHLYVAPELSRLETASFFILLDTVLLLLCTYLTFITHWNRFESDSIILHHTLTVEHTMCNFCYDELNSSMYEY